MRFNHAKITRLSFRVMLLTIPLFLLSLKYQADHVAHNMNKSSGKIIVQGNELRWEQLNQMRDTVRNKKPVKGKDVYHIVSSSKEDICVAYNTRPVKWLLNSFVHQNKKFNARLQHYFDRRMKGIDPLFYEVVLKDVVVDEQGYIQYYDIIFSYRPDAVPKSGTVDQKQAERIVNDFIRDNRKLSLPAAYRNTSVFIKTFSRVRALK